jgi:hypothetical protein
MTIIIDLGSILEFIAYSVAIGISLAVIAGVLMCPVILLEICFESNKPNLFMEYVRDRSKGDIGYSEWLERRPSLYQRLVTYFKGE